MTELDELCGVLAQIEQNGLAAIGGPREAAQEKLEALTNRMQSGYDLIAEKHGPFERATGRF